MTDLPVPLHHAPQPEPYGCAYHAAFAILGDETLLEHKNDANPQRFAAHLAERSILRRTLFNDLWQGKAGADFWERLRRKIPPSGCIPLIVWIESRSELADHHAVAIVFDFAGRAWVSDSKRPEIKHFSALEFPSTRYAEAQEVTQLVPGDLNLFPFQDAGKVMARRLPHDPG